jgi:hypothetical protein
LLFLAGLGFFVARFSGPILLRMYIEAGIGDCQKIPILCMTPSEKIEKPELDKNYLATLLPYEFPKMSISLPKGFTVIQERIKKDYYKKWKNKGGESTAYILHQEPEFFIGLYPEVKKQGINTDHDFIKNMLFAKVSDIKTLTDGFFVIMKSIFIPNVGNQSQAKMIQFSIQDKKGFINYNLSGPERYFNCDVFDKEENFFAIYIKDKVNNLNLEKVLAIVSTLKAH